MTNNNNNNNTITVTVPEGKRAEWVKGVLTLVDIKPEDITERVKNFEDVLREAYEMQEKNATIRRALKDYCNCEASDFCCAAVDDFLRMRLIVAVLNEGEDDEYGFSIAPVGVKVKDRKLYDHLKKYFDQDLCRYAEGYIY